MLKFVTKIELDEKNIKDLIADGVEKTTGNKVKLVDLNIAKIYGFGDQLCGKAVSATVVLE